MRKYNPTDILVAIHPQPRIGEIPIRCPIIGGGIIIYFLIRGGIVKGWTAPRSIDGNRDNIIIVRWDNIFYYRSGSGAGSSSAAGKIFEYHNPLGCQQIHGREKHPQQDHFLHKCLPEFIMILLLCSKHLWFSLTY